MYRYGIWVFVFGGLAPPKSMRVFSIFPVKTTTSWHFLTIVMFEMHFSGYTLTVRRKLFVKNLKKIDFICLQCQVNDSEKWQEADNNRGMKK